VVVFQFAHRITSVAAKKSEVGAKRRRTSHVLVAGTTIDEQRAVSSRGFGRTPPSLVDLLFSRKYRENLPNASSAGSRRSRSLGDGRQDLFVDAEEDVFLDFAPDISRAYLVGQAFGGAVSRAGVGEV
jgi:hypothetical protein